MKNQQILDDNFIKKRFSGQWMGAAYFGFGVALCIGGAILGLLFDLIFQPQEVPYNNLVQIPLVIGVLLYLFFNVVGTIISITYAISGNTRHERFAGIMSLLLNLSPYLGLLIIFLMHG